MHYLTTYPSPIGLITLACHENHLVGLWTEGQKYHGATLPATVSEDDSIPLFNIVKDWLGRYFAGEKPTAAGLPLAPAGGMFRQAVWAALSEIPYGAIATYGDIAQAIAVRMSRDSMSCQAVGGAIGHNPISIIIPCHRVVGSNGSLTGYAGGTQMKLTLLELEGADTRKLYVPRKGTAL